MAKAGFVHLEFYALWDDNTWTVEAVDLEPERTADRTIRKGRDLLETRLEQAYRGGKDNKETTAFDCLGPLYAVDGVEAFGGG